MFNLIDLLKSDLFVYGGVAGIFIGIVFIIVFLYRRITWIFTAISGKKITSPKLLAGLRNLVLILLWTAVFGMLLFIGIFLRTYQAFTYEKEVAEIITKPTHDNVCNITLVQSSETGKQKYVYLIKGEQWMLEGDILKWENWLNFLGLHTRYRLTRLSGRYLNTKDELNKERTVYSLVEEEDHPFWRYLYDVGYRLPLVSTVYGNAVYQFSDKPKHFKVFVSTSGFVIREVSN